MLASRADDRRRLVEQLGADRVGLLRRGIDHLLFDPRRRDRLWLEAELGIPRDRRVVISVGRLDRIKNVLRARRRRFACSAIGGRRSSCSARARGPIAEALVALLGDRVTCPGVLDPDTLARAYASADLCAQPAVIEELSNAVLEASSSGLPLLVGASSGSARFLIDGETGLVVRGVDGGATGRPRSGALLDDAGAPRRGWAGRPAPGPSSTSRPGSGSCSRICCRSGAAPGPRGERRRGVGQSRVAANET